MIVNERIVAYINSLDRGNSPICNTIEKEAIEDDVPIIRKEMGNLLKVLLELKQPLSILEVGTAVGYSSILMSENMPEGCIIDTIENYDKRIPIARNNFKRAGKEDCIRLIEGDAMEVLKELEGTYDFIFMDAAKGQYINYLPEILRLMPKGGLLITDNILQEGELVESRYVVTRSDRTIHTRIREYVYELTHNDNLITSIVPIGVGISLSVINYMEEINLAGLYYNGRDLELLIPASSLEVLKIAVIFGADAVYIGGEAFGLRAKAKNFSHEDMKEGIAFAHEHGVKVYVTVNILAHNYDLPGVRDYLTELKKWFLFVKF